MRPIRSMPPGFVFCLLLPAVVSWGRTAHADDAPTFADRVDSTVAEPTRSLALLFDPFALASGIFGAEADVALGPHLALASSGDVYEANGATVVALGAGLMIYPFAPVFQGLYLEPRCLLARGLRGNPFAVDFSQDVAGVGATGGYQWTWDYGFSLRFGGGAMTYFGGTDTGIERDALALGKVDLVVDASLGWAF